MLGRAVLVARMTGSGVAWHLTLFTAVQSRVVEESAAVTVPLSALKVLITLHFNRRLHTPSSYI